MQAREQGKNVSESCSDEARTLSFEAAQQLKVQHREVWGWSASGPSLSACMSTASFALARAMALGYDPARLQDVLSRWAIARDISRTRMRGESLDSIAAAWTGLTGGVVARTGVLFASHESDVVTRMVMEVVATGRASVETWRDLVSGDSQLMNMYAVLELTREQRFIWLEQNRSRLLSAAAHPRRGAAMLGYAIAVSAPSGLKHFEYVEELRMDVPDAAIWYGLFAGLLDRTEALRAYGGLGHRLVRELERRAGIVDRPHADLALAEFNLLMGMERPPANIAQASAGRLEVELVPGVSTVLRWPLSGETAPAKARSATPDIRSDVARILDFSRDLSASIQTLASKILTTPLADEVREGPTSPRKPRGKGGRTR